MNHVPIQPHPRVIRPIRRRYHDWILTAIPLPNAPIRVPSMAGVELYKGIRRNARGPGQLVEFRYTTPGNSHLSFLLPYLSQTSAII
jgi:hypothetical protein